MQARRCRCLGVLAALCVVVVGVGCAVSDVAAPAEAERASTWVVVLDGDEDEEGGMERLERRRDQIIERLSEGVAAGVVPTGCFDLASTDHSYVLVLVGDDQDAVESDANRLGFAGRATAAADRCNH